MAKSKTIPNWRRHLQERMEQKGFNPRSLSLAAGLNATAVRDMLEGRTQFPRYDTARSLAKALDTTAAILMGDDGLTTEIAKKGPKFGEDIELWTEIIARLQEAIEEDKRRVTPRHFAAMAATLYRRIQIGEVRRKDLDSNIDDFFNYENLREKKRRRYG